MKKHLIGVLLTLCMLFGFSTVNVYAMQIFIRVSTPISKTITIEVEPTDSIEAIQGKLQEKTGYEPSRQKLYFAQALLDSTKTLSDYNIQKESILDLEIEHIYSDDWSSDETSHWHACIDEGCTQRLSEGKHVDTDHDHKCDVCGKIISEHTGGTATCKDRAICEICGESYGELDTHNHTDLQHFEAKEATQTETGNIEYWYCSGCEKYYKDAQGTQEITLADTITNRLPDIDSPTAEAPSTETPTTEAPATEAPTTEDSSTEAPATETPTTEAPITVVPTTETLATKAPTQAPQSEASITPAPKSDTSKTEAPKTGDSSNLALWISLLFVSGTAFLGTTLLGKSKNKGEK